METFRSYIIVANVWFAAAFVAPDHSWLASILGFVWLGMAFVFGYTNRS